MTHGAARPAKHAAPCRMRLRSGPAATARRRAVGLGGKAGTTGPVRIHALTAE